MNWWRARLGLLMARTFVGWHRCYLLIWQRYASMVPSTIYVYIVAYIVVVYRVERHMCTIIIILIMMIMAQKAAGWVGWISFWMLDTVMQSALRGVVCVNCQYHAFGLFWCAIYIYAYNNIMAYKNTQIFRCIYALHSMQCCRIIFAIIMIIISMHIMK